MPYTKNYLPDGWKEGVEGATPMDKDAMNNLETQYDEAKAELAKDEDGDIAVHKNNVGLANVENVKQAPEVHNLIDTTKHPVAALTAGHFLKATGPTAYAFGAHGLNAAAVGADATGSAAAVQSNLDAKMHASTGHKHTGAAGDAPNIAKANVGLANVTNDAQLPIAGGTMTGVLYPQNNTSYTTGQARRIILSTDDPSGGGNGDVWLKYEA